MNDNSASLPADPKTYRQRLLNVAKALRESQIPAAFTMRAFAYTRWDSEQEGGFPCGTPQCALGHYAARRDLQDAFTIEPNGYLRPPDGDYEHVFDGAQEHFGLDTDEVDQLFETNGCGRAKTVEQAARYIEKFVAEKWPDLT